MVDLETDAMSWTCADSFATGFRSARAPHLLSPALRMQCELELRFARDLTPLFPVRNCIGASRSKYSKREDNAEDVGSSLTMANGMPLAESRE